MNIMLNKEYLDDLTNYARENIEFISTAVTMHISDDELGAVIEGKLQEILYYINRAYNRELVELKQQSRIYYQKWLSLKKSDKDTANAVYLEYMKLKCRIELMEIPF